MPEVNKNNESNSALEKNMTRRNFVAAAGGFGAGVVLVGAGAATFSAMGNAYALNASSGYLLVDSKKCGGCETCMLACSLAHSGKSNVNLSRLQLTKNPLGRFPVDLVQNQCRQCPYPSCVDACPTGAMHIDNATGVRLVSSGKCIGCERCIQSCPFTPSRIQWNYEDKCAQKCDLCLNTPYWNEEGGPEGKQACVEACPMKALSFTNALPSQNVSGYDVNLRNEHWGIIGFPVDDAARVYPNVSIPNQSATGLSSADSEKV